MNRPITSTEIETVIKNPTEAQDLKASQVNLKKFRKPFNTYPSETVLKNHKENFPTHFMRPLSS